MLLIAYHPPKLKKDFIGELAELLYKLSIDYDCIVISGYFNIHIDNPSDTKLLLNLLGTFAISDHFCIFLK